MAKQEYLIITALERLAQELKTGLASAAERHKLSPTQAQILLAIDGGATKLSGIAEKFGVSSATISESARSLKNKGLIEKTENGRDGRSKILSLNEEGKKIAAALANYAQALEAKIAKMHMSDKAMLLDSLQKL